MRYRAAIAVPALVFLLVGCSAAPGEADDGATPPPLGPTADPSEAPGVDPDESGPPPLTCDTIIADETVAGFASIGMELVPDYETVLRSESAPQAEMLDLGGIVCKWALPDDIEWFAAGYAPVTAEQAGAKREQLVTDGYQELEPGATPVRLTQFAQPDTAGHNPTHLIEEGSWFFSSHPDGVLEVRDQVAANR